MPATYKIDTAATFTTALLMASGPRLKFGTTEQDITPDGERKWSVQAVVMFHPEYGRPAQSEVITVSIAAGTDPGAAITPGTPVMFEGLAVGVSAPELRGSRIVGGKPWYQASAIRPASGRAMKSEQAA